MSERGGPLTYGNWRKPRAAGFGKLGFGASLGLIATLIGVVLINSVFGMLYAVIVGLVAATLIWAVTVEDRHGVSIYRRVGERMRYQRSMRRRAHVARTGILAPTQGTNSLPGILGSMTISEHTDAYDRPFAAIEHADGSMAVVFGLSPSGDLLVDQDVIDDQVALYGMWLADLAGEIGIVFASVTVETAPDLGERLRREVTSHMVEDAPDVAQRVLSDVVRDYRAGAAQVRAWATIVFDPARMGVKRRSKDQAIRDIAARLPGLTQTMQDGSGAGAVHLMTAAELCRLVRVAYDPVAETLFEEAASTRQQVELTWRDAGPMAWESGWDSLRHDSGHSRVWTLSRPPRGAVQSRVLRNVLAASRDVDRKRVTIIYRPIDAAQAPDIVETDLNQAQAKIETSTRPRARDLATRDQARRAAEEEANGAGLVDFGMIITATSTSDDLTDTASALSSLAASSRLLIRPAYGAQDAAFAMGLPLGLRPAAQAVSGGWA